MGLLRTLLIILLVYYGFRVLYRLFAPMMMRYASRKVEKQFREKYGQQQQRSQQQTAKEGEITIDKHPPKKSNSGQKVGEYIDFEEID